MIINKKFKEKNFRQFYYELQSMKINVIQKRFNKLSKQKFLNKQNKSKDCYTCDKLEHFFRKCIQNKYKTKSSSYNNHGKIITITEIKFINDY